MHSATDQQQQYLDLAAYYAGRATGCYSHELWPEALTHFGFALDQAGVLVAMLYHVQLECNLTQIAIFHPSPDTTLSRMEGTKSYLEPAEPHEHSEVVPSRQQD